MLVQCSEGQKRASDPPGAGVTSEVVLGIVLSKHSSPLSQLSNPIGLF